MYILRTSMDGKTWRGFGRGFGGAPPQKPFEFKLAKTAQYIANGEKASGRCNYWMIVNLNTGEIVEESE